jgi:hypothetical protein
MAIFFKTLCEKKKLHIVSKASLAENLHIPAWEMCEAALQPVVVVVVVSVRREIQAGI